MSQQYYPKIHGKQPYYYFIRISKNIYVYLLKSIWWDAGVTACDITTTEVEPMWYGFLQKSMFEIIKYLTMWV